MQRANATPNASHPSTVPESLRFGKMAQYLLDHLPLGVVVFDRDYGVVNSNPLAQQLLGPESSVLETLAEVEVPDGASSWREHLERALSEDKPVAFGNVPASRNGRNRVLHILFSPLTEATTGDPVGGMLLIEDVTAKVAMENDLATA